MDNNLLIEAFKTSDDNGFIFEGESMTVFPMEVGVMEELSFDENKKTTNVISYDLKEAISESLSSLSPPRIIPALTNKDRKLVSIVIPITKACNLACPYCFAKSNKGMDKTQDFTPEDEKLLTYAIATNTNDSDRVNIIFFGGEPMMRFDIIQRLTLNLKKIFPKKDMGFSITTNGTLINEERAKFLAKYGFAVLLSVDGFENSHNHRRFKNGKHSFRRVMHNFDMLTRFGVSVEFRATLTCDNPYMTETFKYFENLRKPFTIAFAYESANEDCQEYITFNNAQLQRIEKSYFELEKYYLDKINNNEPIYDSVLSTILRKIETRTHQECVCAGGYTYFTLMHEGKLFSCPHLMDDERFELGNISNFESIRKIEFTHTPVSVNSIKECQGCWAKNLCLGGCPSQKISAGRNNSDALPPLRCSLEKLMLAHYLRMYYHIKLRQNQ